MTDTEIVDYLASLGTETSFHPSPSGYTFIPDVMTADYEAGDGFGIFTGPTLRDAIQISRDKLPKTV